MPKKEAGSVLGQWQLSKSGGEESLTQRDEKGSQAYWDLVGEGKLTVDP